MPGAPGRICIVIGGMMVGSPAAVNTVASRLGTDSRLG